MRIIIHFGIFIALVLPDDVLQEALPGNMRRGEHFLLFMKRFTEYLKVEKQETLIVLLMIF